MTRWGWAVGRRKRSRWYVSLHEAGHAVAYAVLGGMPSRATVHRNGTGLCRHVRVLTDLRADAICIAAGDAAERCFLLPPPPGRPRGTRRRRRCRGRRSDADSLLIVHRLSASEARLNGTENTLPSLESITEEADVFVWENLAQIITVARVIFLRGVAFVPSVKVKHRPAGVCLPADTITIAAEAAKGSL